MKCLNWKDMYSDNKLSGLFRTEVCEKLEMIQPFKKYSSFNDGELEIWDLFKMGLRMVNYITQFFHLTTIFVPLPLNISATTAPLLFVPIRYRSPGAPPAVHVFAFSKTSRSNSSKNLETPRFRHVISVFEFGLLEWGASVAGPRASDGRPESCHFNRCYSTNSIQPQSNFKLKPNVCEAHGCVLVILL